MTKTKETKDTPDNCNHCRYYLQFEWDPEDLADELEDNPDTVTGYCRRFPPVLLPGAVAQSGLPEVSGKNGWCGEFTPKT